MDVQLHLVIGWRSGVCVTPLVPIGLRNWVWMLWRRENLLLLPGNKPQSLGCTACSIVTIVTKLSQLPTEQFHFIYLIYLFQIADGFC
jgi:hypothetical protein